MSYESKFIQSLQKSNDDTESDKKNKKSVVQDEKDNKKLELAKETRTTGKIGFSDFVYFLRACGSNTGLFSIYRLVNMILNENF